MGQKGDLSDFDRGMIVGARRAGLSVSDTADVLGFSRTTVSRVYREWAEKEKTSSQRHVCGRKSLVDARGQRKMVRLVQADRKATVTQLTARYNQGMQKTISERTTRRALKQLGFSKQKSTTKPEDVSPDGEEQENTSSAEVNDSQDDPEASLRVRISTSFIASGSHGQTKIQNSHSPS